MAAMILQDGSFVTGMMEWLSAHPELVMALASLALAVFAAVQIALDVMRRFRVSGVAKAAIVGPAWLARRSLEEAIGTVGRFRDAYRWSRSVGKARALDPLQEQMLEIVRLGAEAGGRTGRSANLAFREFLAYADRVNYVNNLPASTVTKGRGVFSPAQRSEIRSAVEEAFSHIEKAVAALTSLAPRQRFEPSLPDLKDHPILRGRLLGEGGDGETGPEDPE